MFEDERLRCVGGAHLLGVEGLETGNAEPRPNEFAEIIISLVMADIGSRFRKE